MDIVRLAKSRCKTHLRARAPRLYDLASAGWRRLYYKKFARYHWTISLYAGADLTRLVPLNEAAEPILSREPSVEATQPEVHRSLEAAGVNLPEHVLGQMLGRRNAFACENVAQRRHLPVFLREGISRMRRRLHQCK